MTKYFPILKAKQGELSALEHFNDEIDPRITPVVEVVPWERGDGRDAESAEVDKAVKRISKAWGTKATTFFVDAAVAELDPENGWDARETPVPVLSSILSALQSEGLPAAPVIRGSSSPEYLSRFRETVADDAFKEAVVRITTEDLDEAAIPLRDLALQHCAALELQPTNVDIMLDFGAVSDESAAAMATRLARFVLPQFDQGEWRSLVLASGAFPLNLSDVAAYTVATLPRNDLKLWKSAREIGLASALAYGDYAVTHPSWPQGAGFAAPPQLRYAAGEHWLVAKGRRQDRRGHAQFFEICEGVLQRAGAEAMGREASWGDQRIHLAAQKAKDESVDIGPGNASTWRAIATSHHLAEVVHQLRGLDEL